MTCCSDERERGKLDNSFSELSRPAEFFLVCFYCFLAEGEGGLCWGVGGLGTDDDHRKAITSSKSLTFLPEQGSSSSFQY